MGLNDTVSHEIPKHGVSHGVSDLRDFKVSSQSRKSEFRVFRIVHLNIYNFQCTQLISRKYSLLEMADIGTFTEPKTEWHRCYHGNHDPLNLKFSKMTVWL